MPPAVHWPQNWFGRLVGVSNVSFLMGTVRNSEIVIKPAVGVDDMNFAADQYCLR